MSVTWLSSAQGLIPTSSRDRLSAELEELFPGAQIIVHTHFRGYSKSPGRAVVLGVEVKRGDDYRTYVAKIGPRAEALSDAKGWQTCTKGLDFASHIMLPVEARPLKDRRRAAVIYPNALTFFGPTQEGRGRQGPHQLDEVVEWAVFDDLPSYESVERVVRQIYTQLDWWFYRSSQPRAAAARAFYRRKLRRAHHRWKTDEERVRLRRDAIWLLGGLDKPDTDKPARYLDPYDLVEWALAEKRVPQTLVGRSHGDLHGKNILVGVQRGEAESPIVIDYSDMRDRNVVAWDFVKLETELKTRLLTRLSGDDDVRRSLVEMAGFTFDTLEARTHLLRDARYPVVGLSTLAFAYAFESMLNELTQEIGAKGSPATRARRGGRRLTVPAAVDKALSVIMTIRQEAAYHLGTKRGDRGQGDPWRDEYYFALAVYGLNTAKFDYSPIESAFALISAGFAAAHLRFMESEIGRQLRLAPAPLGPYPTYRIPLFHAHRLWKSRSAHDLAQAEALLAAAVQQFPHAVPIHQEYALVLSSIGKSHQARDHVAHLESISEAFSDHETICRVAAAFKLMGDEAVRRGSISFEQLRDSAAYQWYDSSLRSYKRAFDCAAPEKKYYPGVNAACLALLLGRRDDALYYAQNVLDGCKQMGLCGIPPDEVYWVLVSEGEASLILGDSQAAADFYRNALKGLPDPTAYGQADVSYDQVLRLRWAMGQEATAPAVEVFKEFPGIWERVKDRRPV